MDTYVKRTVFYSWMSGRPNPTNRSFIERALEVAVEAITKDESNDLEVVIDQDARGETGSADISVAIFDKIDRCDALVADVSIMDLKGEAKEKMPNPNVLVELGYAAGKKGWGKIIGVFNEAFGSLKTDPPFDIRNRNLVPFRAEEGEEDRSEERKKLAGRLQAALRGALLADEEAAKGQWLGKLAHPLFVLLIELGEFEENIEWERRASEAKRVSDELRELSGDPSSTRLGVAEKVLELAERCDAFARESHWRHVEQARALRDEMLGLAGPLKEQLFEDIELSASSRVALRKELERLTRETVDLGERAENIMANRGPDEFKQTSSRLGGKIQFLLHYNLGFLGKPQEVEKARALARTMHLHESGWGEPIDGGQTVERRVQEVRDAGRALRALLDG